MARIAKLYILDEKENEVGRLVLDMDMLIDMYTKATDSPDLVAEDGGQIPQSDSDRLVSRWADGRGVYERSDGSKYVAPIKSQDDE